MRVDLFTTAFQLILKMHENYGYINLIFAGWISAGYKIVRLFVFLLPLYIILKMIDASDGHRNFSFENYVGADIYVYIAAYFVVIITYVYFSYYLYRFRRNVLSPIIKIELNEHRVLDIKNKQVKHIFGTAFSFESDFSLIVLLVLVQGFYMPEMVLANVVFLLIFSKISQSLTSRVHGDDEVIDLVGLFTYVLTLVVFTLVAIQKTLPVTTIVVIFFLQRLMIMAMIRLERNNGILKKNSPSHSYAQVQS